MNDAQLLQDFAERDSEAAFRSLVERHLPLVFGTARRMTGDNGLAEDSNGRRGCPDCGGISFAPSGALLAQARNYFRRRHEFVRLGASSRTE